MQPAQASAYFVAPALIIPSHQCFLSLISLTHLHTYLQLVSPRIFGPWDVEQTLDETEPSETRAPLKDANPSNFKDRSFSYREFDASSGLRVISRKILLRSLENTLSGKSWFYWRWVLIVSEIILLECVKCVKCLTRHSEYLKVFVEGNANFWVARLNYIALPYYQITKIIGIVEFYIRRIENESKK